MGYTREEIGSRQKFVILRFVRDKSDSTLNDRIVQEAMAAERLRPVSREEFAAYYRDILKGRKPRARIAAFGNIVRGPADSGSFPGIPYLNTTGKIKVAENWTRGNKGDLLDDNWEFLFAPVT